MTPRQPLVESVPSAPSHLGRSRDAVEVNEILEEPRGGRTGAADIEHGLDQRIGALHAGGEPSLKYRAYIRHVETSAYCKSSPREESASYGGFPASHTPASRLASSSESQGRVLWESNKLYRALGASASTPAAARSEAARSPAAVSVPSPASSAATEALNSLQAQLSERTAEIVRLQEQLQQAEGELSTKDRQVAKQAESMQELEACISRLRERVRQLTAKASAAGGSSKDGKWEELGAAEGPAADGGIHVKGAGNPSHVQLAPQSYKDQQGCGLWAVVWESLQHHPRRWACAAFSTLALLLIVILCAVLIPGSGPDTISDAGPGFAVPPSLSASGDSWLDLNVQLDGPGSVGFMVFRHVDLDGFVPGTEMRLADALGDGGAAAAALPGAAAALPGAAAAQGTVPSGLSQLAAACGWRGLPEGGGPGSLSIWSVAPSGAAACGLGAGCLQCPRLQAGTAYVVALVAASPPGSPAGGAALLNASTASTGSVPPAASFLGEPAVGNVSSDSFDLTFAPSAQGSVHYAVVEAGLYSQYGRYYLAFSPLPLSSDAILAARPADFTGGIVASGSVANVSAGSSTTVAVRPPCVAELCRQSLVGLTPGTQYQVHLTLVPEAGGAARAPAVVGFATAASERGPALLPPSGPSNVTATGFGLTAASEAAGAVYWEVLTPRPDADLPDPGEPPAGSWAGLQALPAELRRRQMHGSSGRGRDLLASGPAPGALVAPACPAGNGTCAAADPFARVPGRSSYVRVAGGCTPLPVAGQPAALPAAAGLQNNTLYYVLLSTEDGLAASARRLEPPAVYAVRTVDASPPALACGYPAATGVTPAGLTVTAVLTKPGAAFYVVLPSSQAAEVPPTAAEVLRGKGASGAPATASGQLRSAERLPWQPGAAPQPANSSTPILSAIVTGLAPGTNYTVFVAVALDGAGQASPAPVGGVSGVLTPSTAAPTFTAVTGIGLEVDEGSGTFGLRLEVELDRPGTVHYSLYRNYSCNSADPAVADVLAGAAARSSACPCSDASYCARVASGSFAAAAPGGNGSVRVGGELSPLPFESLRNAPEAELKCFVGGLGQASDAYNVYLAAASALPTYNGLSPDCSALPALPAPGGAATCAAAPLRACAQAQLLPDTPVAQAGGFVLWPPAPGSAPGALQWAPPAAAAVAGRPAKVQYSLEGGDAPEFTTGPRFPEDMMLPDGFGMQFAVNKPALVIYQVTTPGQFSGDPSATPFLPGQPIASGKVPVFEAGQLVNVSIRSCLWPGGPGPMEPGSQYTVQYIARDKYGRLDGPCPRRKPSCIDLVDLV